MSEKKIKISKLSFGINLLVFNIVCANTLWAADGELINQTLNRLFEDSRSPTEATIASDLNLGNPWSCYTIGQRGGMAYTGPKIRYHFSSIQGPDVLTRLPIELREIQIPSRYNLIIKNDRPRSLEGNTFAFEGKRLLSDTSTFFLTEIRVTDAGALITRTNHLNASGQINYSGSLSYCPKTINSQKSTKGDSLSPSENSPLPPYRGSPSSSKK